SLLTEAGVPRRSTTSRRVVPARIFASDESEAPWPSACHKHARNTATPNRTRPRRQRLRNSLSAILIVPSHLDLSQKSSWPRTCAGRTGKLGQFSVSTGSTRLRRVLLDCAFQVRCQNKSRSGIRNVSIEVSDEIFCSTSRLDLPIR